MQVLNALLYDGRTTKGTYVELWRDDDMLRVHGSDVDLHVAAGMWSLAPTVGSAPRRLHLPHGAFCELANYPHLEAMLGLPAPDMVTHMERIWGYALGALLITAFLILAGYFWGLPWAARHVAFLVPPEWNHQLGVSTLEFLDKIHTTPSGVSEARQASLRQQFSALRTPSDPSPPWALHFRNLKDVANAFALPSGDIVLTDAFVLAARDDSEILAVLCHETGHVVMRHALRLLLQSLSVSLTVTTLTGDFSNLASQAAGLLELTYSRDMEREADAYAIQMLQTNALSPALLANALETLHAQSGNATMQQNIPAILSTHPDIDERIAIARAAK